VLAQFLGVQRAAVVGRAVSAGNEEIMAFLEMQPNAELDRAALDAYMADHLAPYKRPAHMVVSEGFPMTLSGKVLKRELLASFEAQPQ
jgi:acyl-CoA synthetase (AMP-forming)/AMP-acid ligase II